MWTTLPSTVAPSLLGLMTGEALCSAVPAWCVLAAGCALGVAAAALTLRAASHGRRVSNALTVAWMLPCYLLVAAVMPASAIGALAVLAMQCLMALMLASIVAAYFPIPEDVDIDAMEPLDPGADGDAGGPGDAHDGDGADPGDAGGATDGDGADGGPWDGGADAGGDTGDGHGEDDGDGASDGGTGGADGGEAPTGMFGYREWADEIDHGRHGLFGRR